MSIKPCCAFILAVVILHSVDAGGKNAIDRIPIPAEFLHIDVPRRLDRDSAIVTRSDHSDDHYYDGYRNYDGYWIDVPDGLLFDTLYVATRRRGFVSYARLFGPDHDTVITADGKTLLPAYEERLDTILRILEDYYGESEPERVGDWEFNDPDTLQERYQRARERRGWLLEPNAWFAFHYLPADDLQTALSESSPTDREWIRTRPIYVFVFDEFVD